MSKLVKTKTVAKIEGKTYKTARHAAEAYGYAVFGVWYTRYYERTGIPTNRSPTNWEKCRKLKERAERRSLKIFKKLYKEGK